MKIKKDLTKVDKKYEKRIKLFEKEAEEQQKAYRSNYTKETKIVKRKLQKKKKQTKEVSGYYIVNGKMTKLYTKKR